MDMFPLRLSVFAQCFQLSVKSPLDFVLIKALPNLMNVGALQLAAVFFTFLHSCANEENEIKISLRSPTALA